MRRDGHEGLLITLRSPAAIATDGYLCSRAVLPGMQCIGRSVILHIASVNARQYFGNEA